MLRSIVALTLLATMSAAPALAGNNLFPPDNSSGGAACPDGELLNWTGNSVICTNKLSTTGTCPPNSYMIGITKGDPMCVPHPFDRLKNFIDRCPSVAGEVWQDAPLVEVSAKTGGFPARKTKITVSVGLTSKTIVGHALNCGSGGSGGSRTAWVSSSSSAGFNPNP